MKLITEDFLRKDKNLKDTEYEVEEGVIVTPSAKQYLAEKKIKLIYKKKQLMENEKVEETQKPSQAYKPKYVHINGGYFENKPEEMTQLYGNKLVYKDNKRIILRGKLDSLQAKIMEVQVQCKLLKEAAVVKDLEDTLSFVRKILACEVVGNEFVFESLIGLSSDELRAYSHNPKKHIGVEHIIFPSIDMGTVVIYLNALRAQSREVEISAYQAFKDENGESARKDIAMALNRLSSCYYVMMCKFMANKY